jgi:hypothetical protein
MGIAGFVLSLLALLGVFVALIPFLGWMNWLVLGLAALGVIFSVIGIVVSGRTRGLAIAGLVLGLITFCVGVPRLIIGLGIF